MDTHVEAKLFVLQQGLRSLEDHTWTFKFGVFYVFPRQQPENLGLNTSAKAKLSGEGPRKYFAAYVEWVLVSKGSPFTLGLVEENFINPTLNVKSS